MLKKANRLYCILIGQKQEGLSSFSLSHFARHRNSARLCTQIEGWIRLVVLQDSGGRNRDVYKAGTKSRFSLERKIKPPRGGG
jgi:hypothetical protein